jgi:bacterioferritin
MFSVSEVDMGFDFDRSEYDPGMAAEDSRAPFTSDRRHTLLSVLNEALATDLVYVLRCRQHYAMAEGLATKALKNEFLAHAQSAQSHAEKIARRIVHLGSEPQFNPATLASRTEELAGMMDNLDDLIQHPR